MAVEMNYAELRASAESGGAVSGVRTALASGRVLVGPDVIAAIQAGTVKRGDPLPFARITGILAAKKAAELFPFTRPNTLAELEVDCVVDETEASIRVQAFVKTVGAVGVQMEALLAVSAACLEIFELCKSINPGMIITDIGVDSKTGGQSGAFRKN